MIKCDGTKLNVNGKAIDLLTECGVIIKGLYECGVNKDGLLTDLICAVMKDSTESLEIIKALSQPNLR